MKQAINITMDKDLLAKLEALAKEQSRNRSNMIEFLVKAAIEGELK